MSKTFLVTGASGFLGSHLADLLSSKNFKVRLFDKKKSKHKNRNQKMIIGSTSIYKDLDKAMKKVDIVFHFAASAADLPSCSDDTNGRLYYVESDSEFKVCMTTGWESIEIVGPTGAVGATGTAGSNGISTIIQFSRRDKASRL